MSEDGSGVVCGGLRPFPGVPPQTHSHSPSSTDQAGRSKMKISMGCDKDRRPLTNDHPSKTSSWQKFVLLPIKTEFGGEKQR